MPGESFDIVTGTSSYKLIYKGVCVCLCGADTAVSISFRLWMDLPLSSPRHLSITRSMDTLMTLIMWRGHMAWRSVCVCVCVMYEHECLRRRVCSAVLKADCAGDEAKLLVTSLRISLLGYGDRGNMAAELGGQP